MAPGALGFLEVMIGGSEHCQSCPGFKCFGPREADFIRPPLPRTPQQTPVPCTWQPRGPGRPGLDSVSLCCHHRAETRQVGDGASLLKSSCGAF